MQLSDFSIGICKLFLIVLITSFFLDHQEVNTPICYIVSVKVQFFCAAIGQKRITFRSAKRGLHSIVLATRQSGHNKTFIDGSTRESISTQSPVPLGRGTKGSSIIHCLPHKSWRSGVSAHVQNFSTWGRWNL